MEVKLADFKDALYKKYVPVQVRDFTEKADAPEEQRPGSASYPV